MGTLTVYTRYHNSKLTHVYQYCRGRLFVSKLCAAQRTGTKQQQHRVAVERLGFGEMTKSGRT